MICVIRNVASFMTMIFWSSRMTRTAFSCAKKRKMREPTPRDGVLPRFRDDGKLSKRRDAGARFA